MRNAQKLLASTCAFFFALTTMALAAVNFDPGTGTGFIGKGDAQTLLGWNNHQYQGGAADLVVRYTRTHRYSTRLRRRKCP